ncbi:LPD29 domain-containing protein [Deinococcus soli (ex Cha et al. 2016)]|uniref:Uncharacterized protein n=2 Tax=Deinococcus soli (ex Cha et al. 2016) TaxID=1309411 RepID=A0ACC6KFC4_9DEIO|nr:LPD29 domain-containing protein [Deinococcus soli (ex Cha et al. 2016)]MDR6218215.1 hypothetical protein [Deinococcus soli (ex Cha et al. 2016)]MDR6328955.1 hypothetical protein [Deinococcus soli (ex Cha et al. 2016)]MDR6751228.1 hypothetical protein [Deinococcus soli (ex Cha et al. 2016)]
MTRHLSLSESGATLRAALKEAFPGVRFSVRTRRYAGGASADVTWTDGPDLAAVQAITQRFERADFTPDGANSPRTHVLRGEAVSFAVQFIHPQRQYTPAFLDRVADDVLATQYLPGVTRADVTVTPGPCGADFSVPEALRGTLIDGQTLTGRLRAAAARTAETFYLNHSETAAACVVTPGV